MRTAIPSLTGSPEAVSAVLRAGDALRTMRGSLGELEAMPSGPLARRVGEHQRRAMKHLSRLRSSIDAIACAMFPDEGVDPSENALRVAYGRPLDEHEREDLVANAAHATGLPSRLDLAFNNLAFGLEDGFSAMRRRIESGHGGGPSQVLAGLERLIEVRLTVFREQSGLWPQEETRPFDDG